MHLALALLLSAQTQEPLRVPLHQVVELKRGESQEVVLSNSKATLQLLELEETRDPLRSAIRRARIKVRVNEREAWVEAGNYQRPVTVGGVQIDCTITRGYYQNTIEDYWALGEGKDARLRVWPAGSAWIEPGTFVYPLKQRWFATDTQMSNEPSYVDGPERIAVKRVYYHSGLDIGGCEGMTEVVAATDGVVLVAGKELIAGAQEQEVWMIPGYWPKRYTDQVLIRDDRGWVASYVHLKTIDVRPGQSVKKGQRIGILGKEGGTLWAHLHFEIRRLQPNGRWGTEDGFAFLWDAYHREHKPSVQAVARPHHFIAAGEEAALDGRLSWSASGEISRYEWTFTDGTTATGATARRRYERSGTYSELLKVTDSKGQVDYDFAVVEVTDAAHPDRLPPAIHASYAPTLGVRPGDPVTFKVLSFVVPEGDEVWDFGDGSPPVRVKSGTKETPRSKPSYAETVHRYAKSGRYVATVERAGAPGTKAVARLQVVVGE